MIASPNFATNLAQTEYVVTKYADIVQLEAQLGLPLSTMGIFERNEYIPHGNELVPYENTFMRIWNEFIPTLCWNLHKPKPPKIKTFLMEKGS